MNNAQRSSMGQINDDQSSYISQSPYRQAQLPYQMPKIDHAFIIENYRRLRMQQRDQLAKLRMPDKLKRKIFNFKEDQDLKYDKPELVIFNHPFRGKTVMTKEQVEKQLQRERRNAEGVVDERQSKGQKVQQNILNNMGLSQQQVTVKKAKMQRQSPQRSGQSQRKKPQAVSKQRGKQLAQQINKKQKQKLQGNIYFLSKQKDKEETEKQRTEKMKQLIREKEDSSTERKDYNKSKSKDQGKKRNFKDMPIIGEEPKVVRDIKFQDQQAIANNKGEQFRAKTKQSTKGYYKQFGNEHETKQIQRKTKDYEEYQRVESGQGLIKKMGREDTDEAENNLNKSISEISAIQSKNYDNDLSNSQSLNNALFLA